MNQIQIKITVYILLILMMAYCLWPEGPSEKILIGTGEVSTRSRNCPASGLCFVCDPNAGAMGVTCGMKYSLNCPGRRLSEYQEQTFKLYYNGNNGKATEEVTEINRVRDLTPCKIEGEYYDD